MKVIGAYAIGLVNSSAQDLESSLGCLLSNNELTKALLTFLYPIVQGRGETTKEKIIMKYLHKISEAK